MEISEPTKIVFYASRLFGLAPYVVKRASKGQIVDYKRNVYLIVYSMCLVFCLGANVLGYFPFYCLYYILMMFHVLFAQSALGIGNRYRDLNIALYEMFPERYPRKKNHTSRKIITDLADIHASLSYCIVLVSK
uniref:Uncharacterized protein n=1 Tax=Anopheles farauti TaxID=69004 RepID=A0A182PZE1_9DIPT